MKYMALCKMYDRNYAACLKKALNLLVASMYKINFLWMFVYVFMYVNAGCLKVNNRYIINTCIQVCTHRSFNG